MIQGRLRSALKAAIVAILLRLPLSISIPLSKLNQFFWRGFRNA
jgi:hypothetical protein